MVNNFKYSQSQGVLRGSFLLAPHPKCNFEAIFRTEKWRSGEVGVGPAEAPTPFSPNSSIPCDEETKESWKEEKMVSVQ